MGTTQGSDSCDPESGEQQFTTFLRQFPATAASRLPFVLAEAMVNHKKMVHPPCAC
jgi:hypothetical protein